jgi:hypothetical protein
VLAAATRRTAPLVAVLLLLLAPLLAGQASAEGPYEVTLSVGQGAKADDGMVTVGTPSHYDSNRHVSVVMSDGVAGAFRPTVGFDILMSRPENTAWIDISSLRNGTITVTATVRDAAGVTSTATTTFVKDINATPRLTVAPSLLRYGATADVLVTGTAGAVVDLYSRKYPQTAYTKIRDGLVLDGAGQVHVPTRPDVNLRFLARDRTLAHASSTSGTDGLVTVQKAISLGIARTGTRTYRFSGSVRPIISGTTVGVYRNGVLLRSGIPVSSTGGYSWTGTLAGGTYGFQTRTGTSGYNAASTSPTYSVRIY